MCQRAKVHRASGAFNICLSQGDLARALGMLARGFTRLSVSWVRGNPTHYPVLHVGLGLEVWPEFVDDMGSPRWSLCNKPLIRELIPTTAAKLDALMACLERLKEKQ